MDFVYKCEGCGECCKNWMPAKYDPSMVDEQGNCKYLDLNTNLCTQYDSRPDFCRIDKSYEIFYKDKMSFEEYLCKAKIGCEGLIQISKRWNYE